MTAPPCGTGCGRPSPSAAICGHCASDLARSLAMAASITADLDDAVARLLVRGARFGKTSAVEPPLPFDPLASAVADHLRLTLAGWVDVLDPQRTAPPAATIGAMARWLAARVNQVARHDAAPDIHAEVLEAVAMAVRVLDPPPELHPAGDCECGRRLYAEPGADHADCACGARVTGLRAARAQRAMEADVLGDSEAVSRALAAIGIRVSGGTIRQWVTRGRLARRPGGVIAMSDVLALAGERDERKRR